jgi:VanZ family protein
MQLSKLPFKSVSASYTLLLIYLSLRPIPPEIGNLFNYQDKLMHLTAYSILSTLYQLSLPKRYLAITLAVLLGVLLEIAQSFTTYRSFELLDIVANTLGVGLGFLLIQKKLLT